MKYDDLTWKRVVNENIKRSQGILSEKSKTFYSDLDSFCVKLRKVIHDDHLQLNSDLKGQTADMFVLGVMVRYVSNWSLRLADNYEEKKDWSMSSEQSKQLVLELFSEMFDQEKDEHDLFIKENAKKFVDILKDSRLAKVKSEKSRILKKELNSVNTDLSR